MIKSQLLSFAPMSPALKSRSASPSASSSAPPPASCSPSVSLSPFDFAVSFVCGCGFGLLLRLSRVDEFVVIQRQFRFSSFILLKMFLCAASSSLLSLSLLSGFSSRFSVSISAAGFRGRGLLFTCVGSVLLGVGMQLSGSCPGTVFAQLGAGSRQAVLILIGGVLGALAYGCMQIRFPVAIHQPGSSSTRLVWSEAEKWVSRSEWQGLHTLLGVSRNSVVIVLAGLFLSVVLAAELYRPWRQDLDLALSSTSVTGSHFALPASVAGLLIGTLQLVLFSTSSALLGTSTAYSTFVYPILRMLVPENDLRSADSPVPPIPAYGWKQLMFVSGVLVGGWLGLSVFGIPFVSDSVLSARDALIGGFLLVFGSRMANGCTSGQGITGIGLLSTGALMAVACMFAGAIFTGAIRR